MYQLFVTVIRGESVAITTIEFNNKMAAETAYNILSKQSTVPGQREVVRLYE